MIPSDHTASTSIHPQTELGPISLTVSSLSHQVEFYQDALGLQVRSQNGSRLMLGSSVTDLLELVEDPTATRPHKTTGLYHFALLYPDQRELARVLARLFSHQVPNQPTDHIMTKSTYLDDLEGNGIELYCESPEDGNWSLASGSFITRRIDGSPSSGREPLNVEALFNQLDPGDRLDTPAPDQVKMGHIHLHVSDLDQALYFYHSVLGFDLMGRDDRLGMAFVSAGGYHHHIGLNTWQGKGAPPAPDGALGMRHFTVKLPEPDALDQVLVRVDGAGLTRTERAGDVLLHDPSGNTVLLSI